MPLSPNVDSRQKCKSFHHLRMLLLNTLQNKIWIQNHSIVKPTSFNGGPGSKSMCRFLRTSKSSCGALTSIIFALFPRSLASLLSSSLVPSSLLPLFSSNRLLGPMTSICESSCLPYLFSAFCRVNMQSEL